MTLQSRHCQRCIIIVLLAKMNLQKNAGNYTKIRIMIHPSITWHKMAALRLLIDINKSKFQMFQDGPAFMEIERLQTELGKIKETILKTTISDPL